MLNTRTPDPGGCDPASTVCAHARLPRRPQLPRLHLSSRASPSESNAGHAPEFAPLSHTVSVYSLRVSRNRQKQKQKVSQHFKRETNPTALLTQLTKLSALMQKNPRQNRPSCCSRLPPPSPGFAGDAFARASLSHGVQPRSSLAPAPWARCGSHPALPPASAWLPPPPAASLPRPLPGPQVPQVTP